MKTNIAKLIIPTLLAAAGAVAQTNRSTSQLPLTTTLQPSDTILVVTGTVAHSTRQVPVSTFTALYGGTTNAAYATNAGTAANLSGNIALSQVIGLGTAAQADTNSLLQWSTNAANGVYANNPAGYMVGTTATNSFQPKNGNLSAWAAVPPASYLTGTGATNAFDPTNSAATAAFNALKTGTNSFQPTNAVLTALAGVANTNQFMFTNAPLPGANVTGVVGVAGNLQTLNTNNLNTNNASQLTSGTVAPSLLPLATTSAYGVVKPDGTTITIAGGIISSSAGGGISGTSATNSFQPTNANLSAWAAVTPASYLTGTGATNSFDPTNSAATAAFNALKTGTNSFQPTNANLSVWAATTPAAYITGAAATNSFQPTNANLSAWSAATPTSYLTGTGATNSFDPTNSAATAAFNALKTGTNSFQPTNANLSAWAAAAPASYVTGATATNSFQPTNANLSAWSATPPASYITGAAATNSFQPTNANLSAWAATTPASYSLTTNYNGTNLLSGGATPGQILTATPTGSAWSNAPAASMLWTVYGTSNVLYSTNSVTYTNTSGTNYLIVSGFNVSCVNGLYVYSTNASALGFWQARSGSANPSYFQVAGGAANGSGTNFVLWADGGNGNIWCFSTNGNWSANQSPAYLQGLYQHASGSPTNGAFTLNTGGSLPVGTVSNALSGIYSNQAVIASYSLATNTSPLNLGLLAFSNSVPGAGGTAGATNGALLLTLAPTTSTTIPYICATNPLVSSRLMWGHILEDNGTYNNDFEMQFGEIENLTAYNVFFDSGHNYAAGLTIWRLNAGSSYNNYGDGGLGLSGRCLADVAMLYGTNGYYGPIREQLVMSAQDNPQKDGLHVRCLKEDGYNRVQIGFTPIAQHTIFCPADGVLQIHIAATNEPQLTLEDSGPIWTNNLVPAGATYDGTGHYAMPSGLIIPGIQYDWISGGGNDSGHNGGLFANATAYTASPTFVKYGAACVLSGTASASVTATVRVSQKGFRNQGGQYTVAQGGNTGFLLTGPAGYRDGTTLTNLTALASTATNTAVFSATGITNTTPVNLRVIGFTGTSVVLSNGVTKMNVSFGTISTPSEFTLQPKEMLYGTSCGCVTNLAL